MQLCVLEDIEYTFTLQFIVNCVLTEITPGSQVNNIKFLLGQLSMYLGQNSYL